MSYAFVLIHFGSNPKYLEYEIYSILMLKSISNYDIVYMYSQVDTPNKFYEIISSMNVKTIGFDDSYIIEEAKKFKSVYEHFNTLRTCCFVYSNILTQYDKICIVESDIIFYKGFENVFKLNTPACFIYQGETKLLTKNNYKKIPMDFFLSICTKSSPINGGVMLIKPELKKLDNFKKNFQIVIKNNCSYPNEILFVLLNDGHIYNLPINYNLRKNQKLNNINDIKILGHHFDTTIYKPIDIIKDNYENKVKPPNAKKSIEYLKNKFYKPYKNYVSKLF